MQFSNWRLAGWSVQFGFECASNLLESDWVRESHVGRASSDRHIDFEVLRNSAEIAGQLKKWGPKMGSRSYTIYIAGPNFGGQNPAPFSNTPACNEFDFLGFHGCLLTQKLCVISWLHCMGTTFAVLVCALVSQCEKNTLGPNLPDWRWESHP